MLRAGVVTSFTLPVNPMVRTALPSAGIPFQPKLSAYGGWENNWRGRRNQRELLLLYSARLRPLGSQGSYFHRQQVRFARLHL